MKTKNLLIGLLSLMLGVFLVVPATHADNVAWVGTVDFDMDCVNDYTGDAATDSLFDNYIEQTIQYPGFSIWYNFYTWDATAEGYENDTPGFAIHVDGEEVFSVDSDDISSDGWDQETLDSSGWQPFFYMFDAGAGDHRVTFYAGNTEDDYAQSWVYLDWGMPFENGRFETGDLSGWSYGGQVGVVPIPGAVWLLGSGLVGLFGIKRRNKA